MLQWSANRDILHELNQRGSKLRAKASAIDTVMQGPTIAQQQKVISRIQEDWTKGGSPAPRILGQPEKSLQWPALYVCKKIMTLIQRYNQSK